MAESGSTVFISYSHKDEKLKNRLLTHLQVLEKQGLLDLWEDRQIGAGSNWHAQIEAAITRARVALLLVSPDFLTSDFILGKEIPPLLERRANDGLVVFPVIVRDCAWEQVSWLSPIQARPRDGKPLAQRKGQLDTECKKIAQEVFKLLGTEPQPDPSTKAFLEAFRQRLLSAYFPWDLGTIGVAQARGQDRPVQAKLDDMYLPLRLAQGFDPNKTELGSVLSPEGLPKRTAPLVLRGAAGSGKTTWMRWTFRQLLRRDDALPLMLVLRDVARRWQEPGCSGAARSLDSFLEDWVAENVGESYRRGELAKLLTAKAGPRPVLLVDGWDELGPLGEELRRKLLGLREQYSRILVVVTSRPYGEGRPSHAEGFDVLDIQPLSDAEIQELAYHFFLHCYSEEDAAAKKEADRFLKALERSPEAKALARTALLLTMMLFIGRSGPLPDKRHLLYEECIKTLLTALPDRRKEEGALSLRNQWCPPDSEERFRIVAELAHALQTAGYQGWNRSTIVQTWDGMATLLPQEIPQKLRLDFLAWLAGPAGLLTDRTDGTLAFSHLSFQEYLTAWHLDATIEGAEERSQAFFERLEDANWWETLRLWAALIEKSSPKRLDAVLVALSETESGLVLAGTIFADGLGQMGRFSVWISRLLENLHWSWPRKIELCIRAWTASRQEERKEEIAHGFSKGAESLTWLAWLRCREFLDEASLKTDLLRPRSALSRAVLENLLDENLTRESIGGGRILCGGPPIWPVESLEVGILHVWPGHRRIAGLRLQTALASGASGKDLPELAKALLPSRMWTDKEADFASYFVSDFVSDFGDDLSHDFGRYFGHYFARDFGRYLGHGVVRDFVRDFARDFGRDFARYFARDFARYFDHDFIRDFGRDFSRYFARDFGRYFGRDPSRYFGRFFRALARSAGLGKKPWGLAFASAEFISYGRAGTRAILARSGDSTKDPIVRLLSKACRLSLDQEQKGRFFKALPADLDPLWLALAHHIARVSTPEDKALLIDLAQHPERREAPLSWGLQFIVRGDLMLEDGSVVTLDELADQVELPRLPYLEDMPDELWVNWDAEDHSRTIKR